MIFCYTGYKSCLFVPVFNKKTNAGMAETGGDGSGDGAHGLNAAPPQEHENNMGLDLGSIYRQCSISRSAANTMSVTEVKNGTSTTSVTATPHIGSLNWEGDNSVLKTFHGGRITKNGRITNECMSSSFDPRNLLCLGCSTPHHILNKNKSPVIVFSDQNFVPFLPGGADNCIAVCRAENPTLNELADLAMEIIDRNPLPAGTTLLFGSCSHLYRGGTAKYAADWILLSNRCTQKWPNVNICPLIPIVRSDCPGHLARDISTLACWLTRVYANSTTGLLDSWKTLLHLVDSQCEGTTTAEVCKIPLPSSISIGSVQSHAFAFYNSCPDILKGMDRKATEELLRSLIENLNRDFSANLNPDIIIAESWAGTGTEEITDPPEDSNMENPDSKKHIVLVGGSNMKRLVPLFNAAGYHVTDLSAPSWLATDENIEYISSMLNSLSLDPGYILVAEMLGNSTYRYQQFDGTMALPFKTNQGYHMGGKIGVCSDESLLHTVHTASEIITRDGPSVRIMLPPLPRHLFKGCCNTRGHSTNIKEEGYTLNLLQSTIRLRPVLKNALLGMHIENFFVVDGVGALLGVPPGGNRGPLGELLPDLEKITAPDNIHYTELGYKNLSDTILASINGVKNGTLTKSKAIGTDPPTSTPGSKTGSAKENFFWRGFSSTVGINTVQLLKSGQIEQGYRHRSSPNWSWGGPSAMHHGRGNFRGGRGRGGYRKEASARYNPYRRGY
jgi:hypothetical protein